MTGTPWTRERYEGADTSFVAGLPLGNVIGVRVYHDVRYRTSRLHTGAPPAASARPISAMTSATMQWPTPRPEADWPGRGRRRWRTPGPSQPARTPAGADES